MAMMKTILENHHISMLHTYLISRQQLLDVSSLQADCPGRTLVCSTMTSAVSGLAISITSALAQQCSVSLQPSPACSLDARPPSLRLLFILGLFARQIAMRQVLALGIYSSSFLVRFLSGVARCLGLSFKYALHLLPSHTLEYKSNARPTLRLAVIRKIKGSVQY